MDDQPDIGKLSEAFTVASQEISKINNLPALHDGQRLFEAIERLSTSINTLTTDVGSLRTEVGTLRTEVGTLRTEVGTLRTEVGTLRTEVGTLNTKFDSLELRLDADSQNHTARVYNSHISSRDTPLHELHNRQNMVVAGFPRDSASLMRLHGNTITALLNAFQLSTDGSVEIKKTRFREFIGLVVDA